MQEEPSNTASNDAAARRGRMNTALQTWLTAGQQAQQGARELHKILWPVFVKRYCRSGLTEAVAQELANEAILKVLTQAHTLVDQQAFEKWANTVAHRVLLSHIRHTQGESEYEVQLADEDWEALVRSVPDGSQGDPLVRLCLKKQMQRFCEDHAERAGFLEAAAVNGWSMDEAASVLGRSVVATKEYLSQCRKRLMQYLRVCMED